MNWQLLLTVSVGVLTVIGSVAAARYTGRSSVQVKEVEVEAGAYQRAMLIHDGAIERIGNEMAALKANDEERKEQVKELRRDLEKIKRVLRTSLNFTEKFMPWVWAGAKPPIPDIPESLYEYLDPELIREHRRQQEQQYPPSDAEKKA